MRLSDNHNCLVPELGRRVANLPLRRGARAAGAPRRARGRPRHTSGMYETQDLKSNLKKAEERSQQMIMSNINVALAYGRTAL